MSHQTPVKTAIEADVLASEWNQMLAERNSLVRSSPIPPVNRWYGKSTLSSDLEALKAKVKAVRAENAAITEKLDHEEKQRNTQSLAHLLEISGSLMSQSRVANAALQSPESGTWQDERSEKDPHGALRGHTLPAYVDDAQAKYLKEHSGVEFTKIESVFAIDDEGESVRRYILCGKSREGAEGAVPASLSSTLAFQAVFNVDEKKSRVTSLSCGVHSPLAAEMEDFIEGCGDTLNLRAFLRSIEPCVRADRERRAVFARLEQMFPTLIQRPLDAASQTCLTFSSPKLPDLILSWRLTFNEHGHVRADIAMLPRLTRRQTAMDKEGWLGALPRQFVSLLARTGPLSAVKVIVTCLYGVSPTVQ